MNQLSTFRNHAVDSTAITAGSQVSSNLEFRGHKLRMFNDRAVHVDDVQRAVRCVRKVYRSEPVISARQKLNAFTARLRCERRTGRRQNRAMDQVTGWFAGEAVAVKCFGKRVASIDRHTTSGRELAGVQGGRCPRFTDGVNARRGASRRNHFDSLCSNQKRVPVEILLRQHHVITRVTVAADESVARVVKRHAELSVA